MIDLRVSSSRKHLARCFVQLRELAEQALAGASSRSWRHRLVFVDDQRVFGPHRARRRERRFVQHEQLRQQRLGARLFRTSRRRVHFVDRVQHALTALEAHETEVAAEQDLARVLQRFERVLLPRGDGVEAL